MTVYVEEKEHENSENKYNTAPNMKYYDYSVDGNGTILPMFFSNFKVPSFVIGEISYRIKNKDIFRFDNISYHYYNTPELYWVIMLINGIVNPFDVKEGDVIRILPLSWIQYNVLNYINNNHEDDLF